MEETCLNHARSPLHCWTFSLQKDVWGFSKEDAKAGVGNNLKVYLLTCLVVDTSFWQGPQLGLLSWTLTQGLFRWLTWLPHSMVAGFQEQASQALSYGMTSPQQSHGITFRSWTTQVQLWAGGVYEIYNVGRPRGKGNNVAAISKTTICHTYRAMCFYSLRPWTFCNISFHFSIWLNHTQPPLGEVTLSVGTQDPVFLF